MAKAKKPKKRLAISEQLREAILKSDSTVYRLAIDTGVSQATIGRFVRGERDLQMANADLLAEALGMELLHTAKPKK